VRIMDILGLGRMPEMRICKQQVRSSSLLVGSPKLSEWRQSLRGQAISPGPSRVVFANAYTNAVQPFSRTAGFSRKVVPITGDLVCYLEPATDAVKRDFTDRGSGAVK
jgi:hypothetical protein